MDATSSGDWLSDFGKKAADVGLAFGQAALDKAAKKEQDTAAAKAADAWPPSKVLTIVGGVVAVALVLFMLARKR